MLIYWDEECAEFLLIPDHGLALDEVLDMFHENGDWHHLVYIGEL